ncbi:hypothetical protein HAX54_032050 [Datura stramonium]|uniref:Rubisco accumulation factor 1 C-terminal domain-containing protein n=1 Tax=Datura stramonium TaxID=4076 RepID=A0ABS8VAY7_DATST|nr:hypothetical protein [Datura stramonium]
MGMWWCGDGCSGGGEGLRRWGGLPGWQPIAGLERGGVAVSFEEWEVTAMEGEEVVRRRLVVTDRRRKEVTMDDGFYLVLGGGNGSGDEGLKVERGLSLKEMGLKRAWEWCF